MAFKSKITVTGAALTVDFVVDAIASALAADLRASIALQPEGRWKKTGALFGSINASEDAVAVSADRLVDGRIADAFAEQVIPANATTTQRVRAATEKAITQSLKAEKP